MKKYNIIYKCTLALFLILFIMSFFIINMVKPTKKFSESENRVLEQKPKLTASSLFKGTFTKNFEKYISDQFLARDFWISIKSDVDKAIGKKDNNGVYIGKDGYLMQDFKKPDEKALLEKVNVINSLGKSLKDVDSYFMVAPNAVKILDEKLPKYASPYDQLDFIENIKNNLDSSIKFVDVYNILKSKRSDQIYYRTDHHWTTLGAYYAYTELMDKMGIVAKEKSDFNVKDETKEFLGTLYSKGNFRGLKADTIQTYNLKEDIKCKVVFSDEEGKEYNNIYFKEALEKKDKYNLFLKGNHPFVDIKTNVDNNKKILIVKDSYANSFVPFLIPHYSEIYMVDPRYYSEDIVKFIKENGIKDVLYLYNANTFSEDSSITNLEP